MRSVACSEGVDLLALMLSELATNSVQHADTEFEVEISVTTEAGGRRVRVRVTDGAPGFPTPHEPPADAPHGRGLRIVESLADAWGIEVRRDRLGKTVWFVSLLGAAAQIAPRSNRRWESSGAPARERRVGADAPRGGRHRLVARARRARRARRVADGVVASDEHGLIHYANPAAEELMGWPPGSLRGRSALDLVPESMVTPTARKASRPSCARGPRTSPGRTCRR